MTFEHKPVCSGSYVAGKLGGKDGKGTCTVCGRDIGFRNRKTRQLQVHQPPAESGTKSPTVSDTPEEQYAGQHGCRTFIKSEQRVCMAPETVVIDGRKYCDAHRPDRTEPDALVYNGGTIFQITPLTQAAREWIDENVQAESYMWMGSRLCVEHRYISDIVAGMQQAGLVVK